MACGEVILSRDSEAYSGAGEDWHSHTPRLWPHKSISGIRQKASSSALGGGGRRYQPVKRSGSGGQPAAGRGSAPNPVRALPTPQGTAGTASDTPQVRRAGSRALGPPGLFLTGACSPCQPRARFPPGRARLRPLAAPAGGEAEGAPPPAAGASRPGGGPPGTRTLSGRGRRCPASPRRLPEETTQWPAQKQLARHRRGDDGEGGAGVPTPGTPGCRRRPRAAPASGAAAPQREAAPLAPPLPHPPGPHAPRRLLHAAPRAPVARERSSPSLSSPRSA